MRRLAACFTVVAAWPGSREGGDTRRGGGEGGESDVERKVKLIQAIVVTAQEKSDDK